MRFTRRAASGRRDRLDEVYAIVYFDAVRAKVRDEGLVRNKAVYLGVGVTCAGRKEVPGLWIEHTEGARFWYTVMNELKVRGLQDVLIAVVDGLKGFPETIESVHPEAVVQTCIVHLIRHSPAYTSWKERKTLALGTGAEGDLPGADGGRGGRGAGRFQGGPPRAEVSADRARLAFGAGSGGAVLRLPGTDPAGDLHDQHGREPEPHGEARDPHAGPLPERSCGDAADPSGAARCREQVAQAAALPARGPQGVRDRLRRPFHTGGGMTAGDAGGDA